jgi:release factor glutamine methyltransferase
MNPLKPTDDSSLRDMEPGAFTLRPDPAYQELLDKQPYTVTLNGLTLEVHRNVFPPDLGQCAKNMARLACRYPAATALDMGCGTGFLTLSLKQAGIGEVWGSDIHQPAVDCAARNAQLNRHVGPITLLRSDLFDQFPDSLRFDLIVFNQPFGPGRVERRCGCGPDGGAEICRRFLAAAPRHLAQGGVVLMAFSDRQAAEHDPRHAADALGYTTSTILDLEYNDSRNFIYEMRPPQAVS